MKLEGTVEVRRCLQQFWQAEEAQDLIEYTLIVAIVVLTCIGILTIFTPNTTIIWQHDNTMLSEAVSVASPS
jgi:Flp pilus assembly pilin Flp